MRHFFERSSLTNAYGGYLRFARLALSACILMVNGLAVASPISYTFSGTASGTLDGTAFTNAAFTAVVHSDTSLIFTGIGGTLEIEPVGVEITVAGVGSDTLLGAAGNPNEAPYVFYSQSNAAAGFGDTLNSGGDLIDVGIGTSTWNFATSIGPVAASSSYVHANTEYETARGTLEFDSVSDLSFQATIENTAAAPALGGWAVFVLASLFAWTGSFLSRRSGLARGLVGGSEDDGA